MTKHIIDFFMSCMITIFTNSYSMCPKAKLLYWNWPIVPEPLRYVFSLLKPEKPHRALLNKYLKLLRSLVSFKAEMLHFIASVFLKWVYNVQLYSLGTNQQFQKDLLGTNLGIQKNEPQHWLNLFLMCHFGFQRMFLMNFCEFHLEFLGNIYKFIIISLSYLGFESVHEIIIAEFIYFKTVRQAGKILDIIRS